MDNNKIIKLKHDFQSKSYIEDEIQSYKDMKKEDFYGLNELELERLFKEKGFDVFPDMFEKEYAKLVFYYETKIFNKELYKKLTIYEKCYIHYKERSLNKKYELMVLARRCLINGEKFKPLKRRPDKEQPNMEEAANGVHFDYMLNYLLKLEYVLKQKYNEEGDK